MTWPSNQTGIRTKPVLYYCPTHKRWEPLTDAALEDKSLCDFCCFHKPCPMGHGDEYWEEGWDEFAAEVEEAGDGLREQYGEKYRRQRDKDTGSEGVVIIDYLDLT